MHAELATASPFGSHNGLVARALERLVLVGRGVDPTSLVVPEAGHLALRPEYESNLRAYRDGGRAGVHAWLLLRRRGLPEGAEASPLRTDTGAGRGDRLPGHARRHTAPVEGTGAAADT